MLQEVPGGACITSATESAPLRRRLRMPSPAECDRVLRAGQPSEICDIPQASAGDFPVVIPVGGEFSMALPRRLNESTSPVMQRGPNGYSAAMFQSGTGIHVASNRSTAREVRIYP